MYQTKALIQWCNIKLLIVPYHAVQNNKSSVCLSHSWTMWQWLTISSQMMTVITVSQTCNINC